MKLWRPFYYSHRPQSLCYTLIAFKSIALQNLYGKQDLSLILNTKVSANLNLHLFLQENIQPCGYGLQQPKYTLHSKISSE